MDLGIWVDERTGQFPHVRTVGAGAHREGRPVPADEPSRARLVERSATTRMPSSGEPRLGMLEHAELCDAVGAPRAAIESTTR